MTAIQDWLKPPIWDDNTAKTNAAQVLHFVLLATFVGAVASLVFFLFPQNNGTNTVVIMGLCMLVLYGFWLLRRGRVLMVGTLYIILFWLAAIFLSVNTSGILSPYMVLQAICILLAALILQVRIALAITVLTLISTTVIAIISEDLPEVVALDLPEQLYDSYLVSHWITYVVVFISTTFMVLYFTHRINRNMNALYERDHKLTQHNLKLANEIEKRHQVELELLKAEQDRVSLSVEREKVAFLREFIGTMTHDLKTPVSVIKTSVYLMSRSKESYKKERHQRKIEEQTELINKMIDDLLTASRLEDIPDLDLEPTDLNQLIDSVYDQLYSKAEHNGQMLTIDMTYDLPQIAIDADEIHRALLNLVENAVNYTPRGGSITVSSHIQASAVQITVKDTGIGIDEHDLPHIFDRFYRATNAREIDGGTGLGLAITKRIIDLHGGELIVNSCIGEGTTITIRLPLNISKPADLQALH